MRVTARSTGVRSTRRCKPCYSNATYSVGVCCTSRSVTYMMSRHMVVFRDTQTAVSDTTCQYTDCEESATINLATSTYSGCVIVAAFCAEHGQSQLGSCQVTVLSLTNAEYRCVRQGDQ